jgi:hypothetical protein
MHRYTCVLVFVAVAATQAACGSDGGGQGSSDCSSYTANLMRCSQQIDCAQSGGEDCDVHLESLRSSARDGSACDGRSQAELAQLAACPLNPGQFCVYCESSTDECRADEDCATFGWCTGSSEGCVAGSDADCAGSRACTRYGWCALVDHECRAATAAHCSASTECREWGLCRLVNGFCKALEDADCEQSDICRDDGRCRAVEGSCRD